MAFNDRVIHVSAKLDLCAKQTLVWIATGKMLSILTRALILMTTKSKRAFSKKNIYIKKFPRALF